jgi:hypothetical protein
MKPPLFFQQLLGNLALVSMLVFSANAFAQSPLNPLASTDGGSSFEVCLNGNFLYVGAANTLEVYPVSGPNHTPGAITFKLRLPSNIDQILVHNGYLYVCANHAGLWKFDLQATPATPSFVKKYVPASIDESIYDVAFHGDSLVVAAKNYVQLLLDTGNVISFNRTIASYVHTTSRVHGVDIKGNLLAYTVNNFLVPAGRTVHLVNLNNLVQLDEYLCILGDPWEVYFGENTNLLHVIGGNPQSLEAFYFALDYTNPNALQQVFQDIIPRFPLGIAIAMSADLVNDTLYVATQGGRSLQTPYIDCRAYVYDATLPNNIQLIGDVYGGLYHFDLAVDALTRTMYVASEWYGVLTVDIHDLNNEISLSRTQTGGWCHGSAFAQNRLVEASEGYGVRLYDLSVRQSPQWIAEDTARGFCRAISMSDDGNFVYAWYLTNKRLRVFDGTNLNQLGDTTYVGGLLGVDDITKSRTWGNYVAAIEDETSIFQSGNDTYILVADVSDPSEPLIKWRWHQRGLVDLSFLPSGVLATLSYDSLYLFDPATMTVLDVEAPTVGSFKAMTYSQDTLYVFAGSLSQKGIERFFYDSLNRTLTYVGQTPYYITQENPRIFMATNDTVLYVAATLDSLKALELHPPHAQLAIYDHAADYFYNHVWGVTDLYYAQGLLVLNEYMGQSTWFGTPSLVAVDEAVEAEAVIMFPNPAATEFVLRLGLPGAAQVDVYDVQGRKVFVSKNYRDGTPIAIQEWPVGVYFVVASRGNFRWSGKLMVSGGR